jgi:galactonate dehydratase
VKVVEVRQTVLGCAFRELLVVEVVTDEGLTGLGECRIVNKTRTLAAAVDEYAQRYLLGADPFDVEHLTWQLQKGDYGRPGEVVQSTASAFDMACHDIKGQALGVPVWQLLGGRIRDSVPAYANGWWTDGRDTARLADDAQAAVQRGYGGLKFDPFGDAWQSLTAAELREAVERMSTIRAAVGGDVEVMVEMHGRFVPAAAVKAARALEHLDIAWIEEPVPPENPAALRSVRAGTSLPIATGERLHQLAEFRVLFEENLVDVVQADLTHFGGLLDMKRLAGWAEVCGAVLAPHNVAGPIATMANVHLAVATGNYLRLEHFNDFADPWLMEAVMGGPRLDPATGTFAVPLAAGLGLSLDSSVCREHPANAAVTTLFRPRLASA